MEDNVKKVMMALSFSGFFSIPKDDGYIYFTSDNWDQYKDEFYLSRKKESYKNYPMALIKEQEYELIDDLLTFTKGDSKLLTLLYRELSIPMEIYCSREEEEAGYCELYLTALNLIGIEDFVSLKELYLNEAVGLSCPLDLSNSIGLTTLVVFKAPILSLNLRQNINLTSLTIYDSSNLEKLDLSNNSLLTSVKITVSSTFSQLNLKNGNNGLISTFEATDLTKLTCIQVDDYTVDHLGEAPYNTWTKDAWVSYSKDCGY